MHPFGLTSILGVKMLEPYLDYAKSYPAALAVIEDCLIQTDLPKLENIALRFSYALDKKILDLKSGNEQAFLTAVLVKVTNEMFGEIGALRNGALLASYHHARAVLELFASLEHIYCKSSKKERKLEKFIEYPSVSKYLHFLSEEKITHEEFLNGYKVSENNFQELKSKILDWQRIWNLSESSPSGILNWHHPASIKGLFESSAETKSLWRTYEMLCHVTHLSPLGTCVTRGHFTIGFPRDDKDFDYRKINEPIVGAILAAQHIAICLQEKVGAGLIEGVLDWVPGDDA
jgi:hypothetical protein